MKRVLKIICFLFIFMLTTDVMADDNTWNKSFEYNGFKYNIESFELRVYESEGGTTDFSGSIALVDDMFLSPNEYTINPQNNETTIHEGDTEFKGNFINLNLSLDGDKIYNYLYKKYGDPVSKTYSFYVYVNYSVSQVPSGYAQLYDVGLYDYFKGQSTGYYSPPKFELNKTKSQIIGSGSYYQSVYPAEGVEVSGDLYSFLYPDSISEDLHAYNYLLFKNKELTGTTDENLIDKDDYIIMFHNKKNINNAIKHFNSFTNIDDDNEETNNSDKVADNSSKSEVVNVGNTAFTVPLILSIIGLVILLTGSGVVIYSLFNRKKID